MHGLSLLEKNDTGKRTGEERGLQYNAGEQRLALGFFFAELTPPYRIIRVWKVWRTSEIWWASITRGAPLRTGDASTDLRGIIFA